MTGKKKPRIEWADNVNPAFGSALPYGACTALVRPSADSPDPERKRVCGWPRRKDGTCLAGHPAQPRPRRKRQPKEGTT
jgi:hypothetical protein